MLGNVGFTDKTNYFYFRDGTNDGTYGLKPGGWELLYSSTDCANTGSLGNVVGVLRPGLIYVR